MVKKHIRKLRNNENAKRQINRICTYLAVVMPLTAMPQLIQLYSSHDASGLSLLTWVLGAVGVVPFILYGITHNMIQIAILNTLWLVVNIIMISGVMMYG